MGGGKRNGKDNERRLPREGAEPFRPRTYRVPEGQEPPQGRPAPCKDRQQDSGQRPQGDSRGLCDRSGRRGQGRRRRKKRKILSPESEGTLVKRRKGWFPDHPFLFRERPLQQAFDKTRRLGPGIIALSAYAF